MANICQHSPNFLQNFNKISKKRMKGEEGNCKFVVNFNDNSKMNYILMLYKVSLWLFFIYTLCKTCTQNLPTIYIKYSFRICLKEFGKIRAISCNRQINITCGLQSYTLLLESTISNTTDNHLFLKHGKENSLKLQYLKIKSV